MTRFCVALYIVALFFFFSCNGEPQMDLSNLPSGALGGQQGIPPNSVAGLQGFGPDIGLFNIAATDNEPEMVTVALGAMAPTPLNNVVAGPLIGVINFGAGNARNQRLEFDVPLQQQSPIQTPGLGTAADCNAGVIVSVPANQLYVGMRNDGNLLPPSGAQTLGTVVSNAILVTGSAHVSLGNRATAASKLWRTVWLSHDNVGGGIANGVTQVISIPAFARSVRILRSSSAIAISIFVIGAGGLFTMDGPYAVAGGAQSPIIELSGSAVQVAVTNTGGGAPLGNCAALFDVGF